jgi:pyruvate/2-oxoglutarate/acetoin dehydrogenase E1 component
MSEKEITFQQAVRDALYGAMSKDQNLILIGEDVGPWGGAYGVTRGLYKEFGHDRVRDTPISESAIIGYSLGAALNGVRVVCEIQFCDLLPVCWDQLANQAAKYFYISGGTAPVNMTIRVKYGTREGSGPSHAQVLHGAFMQFPGLKVAVPGTPADAKGMMTAAINDPNPVLFMENHYLYGTKGMVPEDADYRVPLGQASILRRGEDLSIITCGGMVPKALQAAELLAKEGIDAEVVNLRTVIPLDKETVLQSVRKTGRAIVFDEGPLPGGVAAEVGMVIAENCFGELKAPLVRIASQPVPPPYSPVLTRAVVPNVAQLVEAGLKLAKYGRLS